MPADILHRKQTHFVLWRPGVVEPAPTLYIGMLAENSDCLTNWQEFALSPVADADLWEIAAADCRLIDGQVYFYWFKVCNTDPYDPASASQVLYCTDPFAYTVDRRWLAPAPAEAGGIASQDPASVILYQQEQLIPCDPGGETADWTIDRSPANLPPNNRLVIYELPTRWTQSSCTDQGELGNGNFRDVIALLQPEAIAPTFPEIEAVNNRAHLLELGVNCLELLPPADSDDETEWGYGTANFFAADFHLGRPDAQIAPTASVDLVNLVQTCHQRGLRFFTDVVMAFARGNSYHNINFGDFYIKSGSGDPEQVSRDGFGGDLFKYNFWVEGYHPLTGETAKLVPAREYMKVFLTHWMEYYRIDGMRIDSVNNIANYDFLKEFKDLGRSLWLQRGGTGDRFLVVGEELSMPFALLEQNCLDGLWNERFKQIIRQVILGHSSADEPSFETSVRQLIDCRNLGFTDGSQAINYLTSHDLGGLGNERLYDWLVHNGVVDTEPRIKLAFVCLLTAVGIPLILAGEEFADQQDLDISSPPDKNRNKQIDPVNYNRLQDDWRRRIFDYVAKLVRYRQTADALAVNDTEFIHVDFNEGKRVIVWQRGIEENIVVVVANFSDYGTPNSNNPDAKYVIPNWPTKPANKYWLEVTQERMVPAEWAGKEPIFPWEAKVYALI